MNIQQFLEEEATKSPEILVFDKASGSRFIDTEKLLKRDARLINFVLSEVEREVKEKFHCDSEEEQDYLSTTINNLRVK